LIRHSFLLLEEELRGEPTSPQNGRFSPAPHWPVLPAR
jgi:hypothetical protein